MATFARSSTLEWTGNISGGTGTVQADTGAFTAAASFPRTTGEAAGVTTPEELLAASHAACFGIGLTGMIARRGGTAQRVSVRATVTADKGPQGIRILGSHLQGWVEGLQGLDDAQLEEIARATEQGCTISNVIRGSVGITHEVTAT